MHAPTKLLPPVLTSLLQRSLPILPCPASLPADGKQGERLIESDSAVREYRGKAHLNEFHLVSFVSS